jgi:molecular chaperone DnaK (HSP70)
MIKLTKACNKFKETLSANKEALFYVESAFDGDDLKSSLKRSQFEEMNEKIFSKLTQPIEEVLQKSNK